MPASPAAPAACRYIISARAEPPALAAFIASVQGDPDIALVDTIGPPGQVHTAVIEIAPDKAPLFERRFSQSNELIVERDQPLSMSRQR
jgi:hypothetical protein